MTFEEAIEIIEEVDGGLRSHWLSQRKLQRGRNNDGLVVPRIDWGDKWPIIKS